MKTETKIQVINKLGLHARAAAQLVKLCSGFGSEIQLRKQTQTIDAKSIMGVLMLAAIQGTELELLIDGDDAESADTAITDLFADKFGEEE